MRRFAPILLVLLIVMLALPASAADRMAGNQIAGRLDTQLGRAVDRLETRYRQADCEYAVANSGDTIYGYIKCAARPGHDLP